jgi:hypothetical protein
MENPDTRAGSMETSRARKATRCLVGIGKYDLQGIGSTTVGM